MILLIESPIIWIMWRIGRNWEYRLIDLLSRDAVIRYEDANAEAVVSLQAYLADIHGVLSHRLVNDSVTIWISHR
jgi:hypothetical protein